MGATDPFLMGPEYRPTAGIRRFLSGTPAVVAMLAVADMVELVAEVGMAAVREKSVRLTEHAIALADEHLAPLGRDGGVSPVLLGAGWARDPGTTRRCARSSRRCGSAT